jgi:hypothetical protein
MGVHHILAGAVAGASGSATAGVASGAAAAGAVSVGFASSAAGVASAGLASSTGFFLDGNLLYQAPLTAPLSFSTASGAVR